MGYTVQSQYVTGTWIPTYTGFTGGSEPTVTIAEYYLTGKVCNARLAASAGTSNATSFTVTLPFPAASTGQQNFTILVTNGGTLQTTPGRLATRVGSNIADIYLNTGTGTFTASGNKNAVFNITYITT